VVFPEEGIGGGAETGRRRKGGGKLRAFTSGLDFLWDWAQKNTKKLELVIGMYS
jgi:hypothetical protein